MVIVVKKSEWKANLLNTIKEKFETHTKAFIVGVDNVGSKQLQQIRAATRGKAEILMGKNTIIRHAIKATHPEILPYIVGNIGFVFTNEDLGKVRQMVIENKLAAPAKAGSIAQCDVKLSPQNTGMGPEKTSFFQALQIPTKITRGTIETLKDVNILKAGEKVGASEAALLKMLDITPFAYGLIVQQVYDNGSIYSPDVLDITTDDIINRIKEGLNNIASVSLAVGYPTKASIPHSIANALKNMLAIAAVTDVAFKQAEVMKEYLANPSKFAAAPTASTASPTDVIQATPAAKKEEPKEESEEEDMGFGLFD